MISREVVTMSRLETLADVPEDGVPLHVVEICEYLDSNGARCFALRASDAPLSVIVGLLEVGKAKLIRVSTGTDHGS